MSYKKEKLGDYIDILSGFAFSTKDFVEKGVPIIKIKNINPPSVTLDDLTYVSNEIAEKQKKFILSYDDVLIAMTGSHINQWASVVGRVARVKYNDKTLLNQRVGKIIVKENAEVDINYIYYFLSQDTVKIELAAKAGGAANQANISPTHIKELVFPCPNFDTQKKIANILESYDDLIENNQKQIKLLEEAAQRLYKEWFVDLRFPGHEDVAIIDGVPEGWRIGTIDEVVEYHDKKRKPLSSMQRVNFKGKYRYYGAAGILDYVEKYIFDGTYLLLGEDGSVITTAGNPVLQYVTGKFWVNNHAHVLTGKGVFTTEFLYMMFKKMGIADVVTGVAQPKISQARLSSKKIIIPVDNIVIQFQNRTKAFFDKILILEKQIELSKQARDRLLSKLMSGEIEV